LFIVAIVDIFRKNLKKHQQLFDLAASAGRPAGHVLCSVAGDAAACISVEHHMIRHIGLGELQISWTLSAMMVNLVMFLTFLFPLFSLPAMDF
jgi:hypothetical protein